MPMESALTVPLTPVLMQWVETEAKNQGWSASGDFICELVRREHEKELYRVSGRQLTKSMQTLVSGMSELNWADIRKAGRTRLRKRHLTRGE